MNVKDPSSIFSYKTWKLISDRPEQNLAGRVIFQTFSYKNRMISHISNSIISNNLRIILFQKKPNFQVLWGYLRFHNGISSIVLSLYFCLSAWYLIHIILHGQVLHTHFYRAAEFTATSKAFSVFSCTLFLPLSIYIFKTYIVIPQ